MKYVFLVMILIGAVFAASIPRVDLGERIAQNITVMRGTAIQAQAYEMTDNVNSVRVTVDPDKMMVNLVGFAYGSRVPPPISIAQTETEEAIFGIHGTWMSIISLKCPEGKEFLSSQLVSHRSTGFSFNQTDQWIQKAKSMCDMSNRS